MIGNAEILSRELLRSLGYIVFLEVAFNNKTGPESNFQCDRVRRSTNPIPKKATIHLDKMIKKKNHLSNPIFNQKHKTEKGLFMKTTKLLVLNVGI